MSSTAGHPITWLHRDTDPKSTMQALFGSDGSPPLSSWTKRADGSALAPSDRLRLMRGLAIATQYAVEDLQTTGVPDLGEGETRRTLGLQVRGDLYPDRAHCWAASTIARTWILLPDPGTYRLYSAQTTDGDAAVLQKDSSELNTEAGFPPLLLAAIAVVAIAAFTAASCWYAQTSAEVTDRKLTQDTLTARMMMSQIQAVAIVERHAEAERKAGKTLPWDPGEMAVLQALLGTQREIAAKTNSPLSNPFPGAVDKLADAFKTGVQTAIGLGTLALVGGGLYLGSRLLSQEKT